MPGHCGNGRCPSQPLRPPRRPTLARTPGPVDLAHPACAPMCALAHPPCAHALRAPRGRTLARTGWAQRAGAQGGQHLARAHIMPVVKNILCAGSRCETPAYAELTPSLRRPSAGRVSRSPSAAAYAGAYASLRRLSPACAAAGPMPAGAYREAPSKGVLENAHVKRWPASFRGTPLDGLGTRVRNTDLVI